MTNAAMPNLPGFGNITDTMEFVRTMWGGGSPGAAAPGIGIPGMVMPTLSVEEVNKQIADLKAVESWLNLNMNMLRGTIQALEVQSATITALKSMGEAFSSSVKTASAGSDHVAEKASQKASQKTPESASESASNRSTSWTTPKGNPSDKDELDRLNQNAASEEETAAAPAEDSGNTQTSKGSAASPPVANPAVWWNLLQDQFKQAVGNAMAGESTDKERAPLPKTKAAATPKRGAAAGVSLKPPSAKKAVPAKSPRKRTTKPTAD